MLLFIFYPSNSRFTKSDMQDKKSKEIVFIESKRKREAAPRPEMAGIVRVTSLKILGVTVTNKLSASDHERDVISNCAKSLSALRVLRARGMCDSALQAIYRSDD